ncbi:hypothetical protein TRAPUB_3994 [Trametes pubescens]|uniref:Uncharacterized protein n=1 Tax=Trametes pubescens TaxID=154538 RepID=A0A1M2VC45_TRAPU|nr:hypothetical protein TRAPUB_3994 [Trametes pubescens]
MLDRTGLVVNECTVVRVSRRAGVRVNVEGIIVVGVRARLRKKVVGRIWANAVLRMRDTIAVGVCVQRAAAVVDVSADVVWMEGGRPAGTGPRGKVALDVERNVSAAAAALNKHGDVASRLPSTVMLSVRGYVMISIGVVSSINVFRTIAGSVCLDIAASVGTNVGADVNLSIVPNVGLDVMTTVDLGIAERVAPNV